MQITLTLDLTAENLDKLKVFCQETGAAPAPTAKPVKTAAAKQAKAEDTPPFTEDAAQPAPQPAAKAEEKTITLTDVRAVALKLSKAGKSDVLKAIFAKFGAAKLSEVPAESYGALMEELTKANG